MCLCVHLKKNKNSDAIFPRAVATVMRYACPFTIPTHSSLFFFTGSYKNAHARHYDNSACMSFPTPHAFRCCSRF